MSLKVLEGRMRQVCRKGSQPLQMECDKASLAGSVSQRACVFCGSRVVLYPIADALHLVHGPIGCAAYTWDIRGAVSSGPQLHRLSFSTDLKETEVIFGGENKLYAALMELIEEYKPKAAFVYATCIVGIIGDDVEAVCKKAGREKGIPVIPVHSEGFKGTKKDGYRAACEAIFKLVGTGDTENIGKFSINILGEFNVAKEAWLIKDYFKQIGIEVVATFTGDGRIGDIRRAHGAKLNLVQCSGSMTFLAKMMQEKYGIPFIRVSYFGFEDMAASLYSLAEFFSRQSFDIKAGSRKAGKGQEIMRRARELVRREVSRIYPEIERLRKALAGKKAAIYVGGAFKALSLIKALRLLDIQVAVVGTQTGSKEDYQMLKELCDEGTIIVDDSNPVELAAFVLEKEVDIFIGGVKERPIAYKLGIGFCDHNHERKIPLAGFEGMLNFAREVYSTVMSPVWQWFDRAHHPSNNPERRPSTTLRPSPEFIEGRSRGIRTE